MSLALLTLLAAIAAILILYRSPYGSPARTMGRVLHALLAGVATWAAVSFFARGLGDWLGILGSTLSALALAATLVREWALGRQASASQPVVEGPESEPPHESQPAHDLPAPSAARPALSARAAQGRTRGEREAYRARRRRRIATLAAIPLAATSSVASILFLLDRKPAHDAPVVRLFLAADEAELFSVDLRGMVKRWNLPGGGYRAQVVSPILATARRIEAGPDERILAFLPEGIAVLDRLDAAAPKALWTDAADAAFSPDGQVILADATGLTWRSARDPAAISHTLRWPEGSRRVAVSRAGDVSFVDLTGAAVTIRGTPPVVVRTVPLASACDRMLYTPSGSFLLLLDSKRGSFAFLGRDGSEPIEGPEGFDPDHIGFVGPDTLATGAGGARRIDLTSRAGQPYWRAGISTTMLVASPRHACSFLAAGPEIYRVQSRGSGKSDGKSEGDEITSRRLRHWRF